MLFALFYFIIVIIIFFQEKNDTCIWYGQCGLSHGMPLNCLYKESPKPITDAKNLEILNTWCPDFVQDHSEGKWIFYLLVFNLI